MVPFSGHLTRLTLVGIHTQPSKAAEEIDALSDVLDYVETELGAQNVVLLGDFNAGCSYVTGAQWEVNRLKGRADVTWTIADHTDTTVHATNCAYDRYGTRTACRARSLELGEQLRYS